MLPFKANETKKREKYKILRGRRRGVLGALEVQELVVSGPFERRMRERTHWISITYIQLGILELPAY